jgi:hypothetical protein
MYTTYYLFLIDKIAATRRKTPVRIPIRTPHTLTEVCLSLLVIYMYGKGEVHPRTGHEWSEGEQRYSCTLSVTSALDGGWVVNATPRPIYPWEKEPAPIVQEVV